MKTTKRSWLIRIAFVLVLVLVAVLMLRIGRGHTVYFDNRAVDKGGQSVEAPYKITVYVNGEQISKLYEKERCLTTVIGDKLELTVEVMQQKGGSETTETYQMTLPHNIDGSSSTCRRIWLVCRRRPIWRNSSPRLPPRRTTRKRPTPRTIWAWATSDNVCCIHSPCESMGCGRIGTRLRAAGGYAILNGRRGDRGRMGKEYQNGCFERLEARKGVRIF